MSEPNTDDTKAALVIDDNAMDLVIMTTALERAGYDVTPATDGDMGAELIVSRKWALAVVDLMMPGKDGVEVIQVGRDGDPDLQILVVSGSSNAPLIDAAFRAGANFHLTKPIELEELLNQIGVSSEVGPESEASEAPESSVAPEAAEAPGEVEHTTTVVAVGACPGDVEMGCGGVLFQHRGQGHNIVIINLAGGGDPQSPIAASANLATDILEARIESTGDRASGVVDTEAATSVLREVFEASKPNVLYLSTTSSDRASSVECHRVALSLAEGIPNILAYQDPGATVEFSPQYFVDLTPDIKRKLEPVGLYDRFELKNASTEMANATALFWGRFAEHTLVEPLEVVRQGGG